MIDFKKLEVYNIETLKRADLDTRLQFIQINDAVSYLKTHFLSLKDRDISLISNNSEQKIIGFFNEFIGLLASITSFQLEIGTNLNQKITEKNTILNQVMVFENKFNSELLPIIHELQIPQKEFQENIDGLKNQAKQASSELDEKNKRIDELILKFETNIERTGNNFQQELSKHKREVQEVFNETRADTKKLVDETRNITTKKLVEKYGKVFSNQAKLNRNFAIISGVIFALFVASFMTLMFELFLPLIEEAKTIDNIYPFVTKIIFRFSILAVGAILIKESLKSYNVNMHLYNLNKHRQNSLLSFDTLTGTSIKPETRDTLTKEIARTIYSVNKIGYLVEDKKNMSTNQIVELIKTMNFN